MEYTVQKLADLAGVSARTLRYYDQIGLLSPGRVTDAGYRIYGPAQVDRLQQILFYRELGIPLDEIREMISDPACDTLAALERYREELHRRQENLVLLIRNVDRTILSRKGMTEMSDKEKFEGFKKELIRENERKYGEEIRQKYDEAAVSEGNEKLMSLSQEDFNQMQETGRKLQDLLEKAVLSGADPGGEMGREIARLHKRWLTYTWPHYTPEAHAGLTRMYLEDSRFTRYYDNSVKGCAEFLHKAVATWLETEKS